MAFRPRLGQAAVTVLLVLMSSQAVRSADLSKPGGIVLDEIHPTAPRGLAADLPRSPLADIVVNGALRFPTAEAARHRCPRDQVVFVDAWSAHYALSASGGAGAYMCKSAALQEGDRPF